MRKDLRTNPQFIQSPVFTLDIGHYYYLTITLLPSYTDFISDFILNKTDTFRKRLPENV